MRALTSKKARPSGLKYNIKVVNKGWIKKGQALAKGISKTEEHKRKLSEGAKGQRRSPTTEFKRINGNGYRHLLLRGILPQYCEVCLGEPGLKRLHVHHKDHNHSNNDINNLQILCRPCHLKHHNRRERVYVEGRKAV